MRMQSSLNEAVASLTSLYGTRVRRPNDR